MLVQSHRGFVELLPALPAAWADGEVRGLRARGGFEIGIRWCGGTVEEASVGSLCGGTCRLRWGGREQVLDLAPGEVRTLRFR